MNKAELRNHVWDTLESTGVARFPFPPHGRIPNYAGADEAAARFPATDAWADAATIKANPDSPQRPVRKHALEAGKTIYMAVPRLRDEKCFIRLDPAEVSNADRASTIKGANEIGVPVRPESMRPIDLVVTGSVAVNPDGARVGKGEGYSDLEFAVLRELDLLTRTTPVATTVHDRQVLTQPIPVDPHDVPLDLILTPTRFIPTDTPYDRPAGIDWDLLDPDQRAEIPILDQLHP